MDEFTVLVFISALLCGCGGAITHLAPPNSLSNIPGDLLISAVKNCKVDEVEKLLSKNVSANIEDGSGRTPLLISVLRFTPECQNITEMLINARADVNVGIKEKIEVENEKPREKHFPLHNVALYGNTKIAELLINNGAEVNILDENKYSPLAYAIYFAHNSGNSSMAKLLIEKEADVDEKSKGEPLLILATKFGLDEVVELLLDHGAHVNAVDENFNTALHKIAEASNLKDDKQSAIIESLLSKRADVKAKNFNDKTPIDLASNNKIKELLTGKVSSN